MFTLLLIPFVDALFSSFEYVQVTSQLEYSAYTFKGIITVIPQTNNVLLWKCHDLEDAIPNISFNLLENGTLLKLNDFNLQYEYEVKPNPQFTFTYQDPTQGILVIDYLTYKNPEYALQLKQIIDRVIIDEYTVDWETVHYNLNGLQDNLLQFCKKHQDFKIEL
ncbi:unnamed protein product (macronuclear) [Paramecium tetraurelia]|uniref:GOLD domain-containing protein n=1 Tax=Paramecium tetraurelia TaxID=5888 RepID=A0C3P5_PARTE|nr:uncharacterized protein GSPATT00034891001 [Paramecium tetraurelia]CAK65412.1 unnamed protein product [Paramecium tetraurelia]|eukprot:XP_001432809.1 hypothetical protein (macronuclear) [Paramecium tetraurelia strain d4-2]